jgi:hypothetical protein
MLDITRQVFVDPANLRLFRELHNELLIEVSNARGLRPNELDGLTTFLPRRGLQSTNELMIIGRAPNGWRERWIPSKAAEEAGRREILDQIEVEITATRICPMTWATAPQVTWNWRRSAFMRLMKRLSALLPGYDEATWPSRLIWSNLYKVAPYEGGNPKTRLCDAQLKVCLRYLATEIEVWRPQRVVIVAGWNWAQPFIDHLTRQTSIPMSGKVHWKGVVLVSQDSVPVKIVVCIRPEGKSVDDLCTEITSAFDSLSI